MTNVRFSISIEEPNIQKHMDIQPLFYNGKGLNPDEISMTTIIITSK